MSSPFSAIASDQQQQKMTVDVTMTTTTATATTKQHDTSGSASLSTTESPQEKDKINKDVPPLTPGEWRKLRWRLDLRIVLLFALLYMWSAMDRSNIGKLGFCVEDPKGVRPGTDLVSLYHRKCQARQYFGGLGYPGFYIQYWNVYLFHWLCKLLLII